MKLNVALALVMATATSELKAGAPIVLRVDTAIIRDAADGTSATGASWRAWPVEDPSWLVASGPSDAVGQVRAGAAWVRFPEYPNHTAFADDRIIIVETGGADPCAPGGVA